MEIAKILKFKCDILSNFQAMCEFSCSTTYWKKIQILNYGLFDKNWTLWALKIIGVSSDRLAILVSKSF